LLDLVSQRLVPSAMEPRSTIAEVDKKTGRLTLHVQSQTPASTGDAAADAVLKRPKKASACWSAILAAASARRPTCIRRTVSGLRRDKTGKKVRWRDDRTDEFVGGTHGRDLTSTGEFALDAKARVLAYRVRSIGGTGAYSSGAANIIPLVLGPFTADRRLRSAAGAFRVKSVMTNTAPVGAYRGAGRPEAVFIVERLFDAAARQIGMDPRTIRKINYIKPAHRSTPTPSAKCTTPARSHICWSARRSSGLERLYRAQEAAKKACSAVASPAISNGPAGARTPKGQLARPAFRHHGDGARLVDHLHQMVADTLGIPMDKIDVVQGDTDLATGFGSVGSRSLFVGGTAVAVSTNDMINKAHEKASNMLEASVEDIEYRGGFTVVGTDRRVSLFEIARKENGARLSVDPEARSTGRLAERHA
jgi:carbon-monoxide dehydrogenase large subunit